MPFQLSRIDNQHERVWLYSTMFPFDDPAGEFFFGRRRDRTMNAGQVDDVHRGAEFPFALALQKRNGDAGIIGRSEVSAGDGVHERGFAGVRHSHETNGQFFGLNVGFLSCRFHWLQVLGNHDPRRLALTKSEKRAANADHERVTQWGGVRNDDFFSGSETQVEQPVAVFARTFEPLDPAPSIESHIREPLGSYRGGP